MTAIPDISNLHVDEVTEHYESSDLGNARRLVAAHGQDLRHAPQLGRWLVWDGRRWSADLTGEAARRAKDSAESILDEARANSNQVLFKQGIKAQSHAGIVNALALASTEPGIPVLVDDLDSDPWLLTVANGTLDLRTGQLRAHSRADLITRITDIEWDPTAICPMFDVFLAAIQPDPAVRAYLQRGTGYALTGVVTEHTMLINYGLGSNGKTTLAKVQEDLLGEHATPASPKLLVAEKHEQHPTAIADLQGRRLVISSEVEEGHRLDEALVKQLTGGDRLKARHMRQDFFTFTPTHKIWVGCNHKPKIRGADHGIWRRIKLIPFTITIPDEDQDKHLDTKLHAELPGILRWAVEGCLDWQRRGGLDAPAAILEATEQYRLGEDTIATFLADTCTRNTMLKAASSTLYETYKKWCAEQGIQHPLTQKALAGRLREQGLENEKDRTNRAWWLGIGLNTTEGQEPQ